MAFIKFTKKRSNFKEGKWVKLTKWGSIVISRNLIHVKKNKPVYVEFYHDPDEKKIGIKVVDEKSPDAYKLIMRNNIYMTTSKPFLKVLGIEKSITVPAEYDPKLDMIVAQLK